MDAIAFTTLCISMFYGAGTSDAVVWRRELGSQPDSTYKPVAMAVDNIGGEVIVLGTSRRIDTEGSEIMSWRIQQDGHITRTGSLGSASKRLDFMMRVFGMKATTALVTGDLVQLRSQGQDDLSVAITDKNLHTRNIELGVSSSRTQKLLLGVAACQDGLLVVGQSRGKDGVVIKSDMGGNVLWEETFDRKEIEVLSSVACAPGRSDCYVAGISASVVGDMTFDKAAIVCMLRYDSRGELIRGDFFEGGFAPWPTSMPKVVCLPSGVVLVAYDAGDGKSTDLHARAYARDLTVLWDKQVLKTGGDSLPVSFDICAGHEDRFVLAAIVDIGDLRIYEYEGEGTLLQAIMLEEETGLGRVHVACLPQRILVAAPTSLKENEEEGRIKLLAVRPCGAN